MALLEAPAVLQQRLGLVARPAPALFRAAPAPTSSLAASATTLTEVTAATLQIRPPVAPAGTAAAEQVPMVEPVAPARQRPSMAPAAPARRSVDRARTSRSVATAV